MTFRLWIYGGIVTVLALAFASTCGYEKGKSVGQSSIRITLDDSVAKANARTVTLDSINIKAQSDSLKVVLMERDSLAKMVQKAQRQRDTSLAFATTERKTFELKGDTAVIDGRGYVLPVTISTYVRLSDTAFKKQGELDAIEAQADSNASRTIARLESLHTVDTTLITDQRIVITQQTGEIKDLKAAKTPRFGFKAGVATGVAIVATLIHFIK